MPGLAITRQQRDQVLELHAEGMGRNDIARQVGIAASTVTKIVHGAGGDFDRKATAAATKARKIDARARRAELAALLLEDAHRLRAQLWQPALVYNFGGKDNTYEERILDQPPVVEQLKLVQAAGAAITKHIDIERHDTGEAAADARSMLADLGRALGVTSPDDSA